MKDAGEAVPRIQKHCFYCVLTGMLQIHYPRNTEAVIAAQGEGPSLPNATSVGKHRLQEGLQSSACSHEEWTLKMGLRAAGRG